MTAEWYEVESCASWNTEWRATKHSQHDRPYKFGWDAAKARARALARLASALIQTRIVRVHADGRREVVS